MKINNNTSAERRSAFTLLELLAVISVIAILVALIMPALMNAFRNTNNAEVSVEFSKLTTAMESFKSDHGGIAPWSAIVLRETGGTNGSNWDRESRSRIRRIWPQYNFASNVDFNGDGDTADVLTLTASECLVFFLGGMRTMQPSAGGPSTPGLQGFSKNPINPFNRTGENREIGYFEFDPDQLVDVDSDGMLDYMDPLADQQLPILFVSNNNGQGYATSDGSLNFYVQGDGTTPWKKGSFQLISPGGDGEFGFEPIIDSSNPPLAVPQPYSSGATVPQFQDDNITNFSDGTLGI